MPPGRGDGKGGRRGDLEGYGQSLSWRLALRLPHSVAQSKDVFAHRVPAVHPSLPSACGAPAAHGIALGSGLAQKAALYMCIKRKHTHTVNKVLAMAKSSSEKGDLGFSFLWNQVLRTWE